MPDADRPRLSRARRGPPPPITRSLSSFSSSRFSLRLRLFIGAVIFRYRASMERHKTGVDARPPPSLSLSLSLSLSFSLTPSLAPTLAPCAISRGAQGERERKREIRSHAVKSVHKLHAPARHVQSARKFESFIRDKGHRCWPTSLRPRVA